MQKYSVLMSLYVMETPGYLELALDSMLNQTIEPDEIVIVEDGLLNSELYEILDRYEKNSKISIRRVRNEKNLGLGLALNEGLKVCSNELVARMDTDDISMPERCEKQLKLFEKKPHLSIVGAYVDEFITSPNNVISTRVVPKTNEKIYEFAKRRSAFNHPVVMYRKSDVLAQGGYTGLRRNQDVDLFGRMLFAGLQAENIGESLLLFRSNDALAKRRRGWENTKSYIDTIRKFWQMGYSNFFSYTIVAIAQTGMFLMPVRVQQWVYKKLLRK